jgi:hypothetical protein
MSPDLECFDALVGFCERQECFYREKVLRLAKLPNVEKERAVAKAQANAYALIVRRSKYILEQYYPKPQPTVLEQAVAGIRALFS